MVILLAHVRLQHQKRQLLCYLVTRKINQVSIVTPKGWDLSLDLHNIIIEKDSVACCVIKDAGDDPDVTNRLEICARVKKAENGITITGGKGVGKVTKKAFQYLLVVMQ